MKKIILVLTIVLGLSTLSFGQKASSFNITEQMIADAQKAWCGALVQINEAKERGEDYKKVASDVIDAAYYYQAGPVLFKPTLTSGDQTFRMDKEGAMAYFVGGNDKYKNDNGFALRGWKKCESKPRGLILNGDMAISMGNVYIWNARGEETVVDKTWGYKLDEKGSLRIILHHSSLPFKP
ncbi:MAG: hypothetical protein LUM44_07790 [Pyrinomonadaceae bacterium]|nr:hypothetical protein [Pyrinomonadaceae bacterium]